MEFSCIPNESPEWRAKKERVGARKFARAIKIPQVKWKMFGPKLVEKGGKKALTFQVANFNKCFSTTTHVLLKHSVLEPEAQHFRPPRNTTVNP